MDNIDIIEYLLKHHFHSFEIMFFWELFEIILYVGNKKLIKCFTPYAKNEITTSNYDINNIDNLLYYSIHNNLIEFTKLLVNRKPSLINIFKKEHISITFLGMGNIDQYLLDNIVT